MFKVELLTRGTALLAVMFFTAALCLRILARRFVPLRPLRLRARRYWTLGCAIFLLHVGCAFQFVHGWSHGAAYEATARETFEVTGWNSGSGLYANYLFTLLWVADVIAWWRGVDEYESRPRWVDFAIVGYLGFIAFNATVIFGDLAARAFGIASTLLLCAVGIASNRPDKLGNKAG